MAKRTKYGELTKMVCFRIPESMVDRIRDIVYLSIDKMQTDKPKESIDNIIYNEVMKSIKTPTQTTFVPFTAKKIMVVGYACLKNEDSDCCYWKDTSTTALIFDNELHLKEYLIKFKP
ncbi:MAG TPA: hypothetical protein PLB11_00010 [Flavobacterium sp.]|nr:hypothetical protein [Flavobacterium sp.]